LYSENDLKQSDKETSASMQLACHECDLLVNIPELADRQKASCPRCHFVFTRYYSHGRSKLFALSSSSLLFLIMTLFFPFLIFTAQGSEKSVFFVESISSLGQATYFPVVLFMLMTTLIIPALMLLGVIYVLVSTKLKRSLPANKSVLRLVFHLRDWNMAEIFLLGILVSMVKIASLADVSFGLSFLTFVLFVLSLMGSRVYLDRVQAWSWIARQKKLEKNN